MGGYSVKKKKFALIFCSFMNVTLNYNKMKFLYAVVLCFCSSGLLTILAQQEIGDKCTTSAGEKGICTPQTECVEHQNVYTENTEFAETCKLNSDGTPIICCLPKNAKRDFAVTTKFGGTTNSNNFTNNGTNETEGRFYTGPKKKQYNTKQSHKTSIKNGLHETPNNVIYNDYQSKKPYPQSTVASNNDLPDTYYSQQNQPAGFVSTFDSFGNLHVIPTRHDTRVRPINTAFDLPPNNLYTPPISNNNVRINPVISGSNSKKPSSNGPTIRSEENENNHNFDSSVVFKPGNSNSESGSVSDQNTFNGNVNYPNNNNNFGSNENQPRNPSSVHYPSGSHGTNGENTGSNQNRPGDLQSYPNSGGSNSGSQNNNGIHRPVTSGPGNQQNIHRPLASNEEPIWGTTERTTTRRMTNMITSGQKPNTRPTSSQQQKKRISEQKCAEYSRNVTSTISALPLTINGQVTTHRVTECPFQATGLIVGGEKVQVLGEYPHMAAIGFRSGSSISYSCGGTLISEDYVMTAAHCTHSSLGNPVHVRLGDLKLIKDDDGAKPQIINVAKVTVHPNYKPPVLYNDIALLKLSRKVSFNKVIRPACLQVKQEIDAEKVVATGWGATNYGEVESDDLLKVALDIIDNTQCNALYGTDLKLPNGMTNAILCAGILSGNKDTCQGDSGGPLQIHDSANKCIHYVVGITSSGKSCGAKNTPGIYTRVSEYVSWIENLVWRS